jgi:hypothetical protein
MNEPNKINLKGVLWISGEIVESYFKKTERALG